MTAMPTEMLALVKEADGYYRTTWYDKAGRRHRRSFGKERVTSRNRFNAFHGRWRKDAAVRDATARDDMTIREAFAKFDLWAQGHYVRADKSKTGEADAIGAAMVPVLEMFGETPASDFDVGALKVCRERMVKLDWCVNTINARVRKVRQVFKKFIEDKLCEPVVLESLRSMRPLAKNRGAIVDGESVEVRATEPVPPVPLADINAARDHLPQVLSDMVLVQFYTGMRPTELCRMRPIDIDTAGDVWRYQPRQHKTLHKGINRVISIGPQAQAVLTPYLSKMDKPCFSPADAVAQRLSARVAAYVPKAGDYRKAKSYQTRERTGRGGEAYDRTTYARAIARACDDAGIDRWSPNQLRHNAATNAWRLEGLKAAQLILGHSRAKTTELYLGIDSSDADAVARRIG